jgi:hypothetical protein
MNKGMRNLYNAIMDYKGDAVFNQVIRPWIKRYKYGSFLRSVGDRFQYHSVLNLSQEEKWEFFALAKVFDVLTLPFQPNKFADCSLWPGPNITMEEWVGFVDLLGLDITTLQTFHPFHCEILEAFPGNADFELADVLYPEVKLGGILIKRAGVSVTMHSPEYPLAIVNDSTLYWATRRKNRKYDALSQGWGNNSQWRTEFRFDVETPKNYIYNFFGPLDLHAPKGGVEDELIAQNLNLNEGIDLVRFRHLISTTEGGKDLIPYTFRFTEGKTRINQAFNH